MTRLGTIITATAVAGTLDILAAIILGATAGTGPAAVLRSVAAGPLGDDAFSGGIGMSLAGLVIHFAIMAVIVTVFVLAARKMPMLTRQPWLWGPVYGLAVWAVMYLIILPARWPSGFPQTDPVQIAWAIAFHTLLVGLSIALITARRLAGATDKGVLPS
jgi:uncharacterized membrane protein YagU involved in acid resistance